MYNYSRIGPWPVIDVDQAYNDIASPAVTANAFAAFPFVTTTTPAPLNASTRMACNDNLAMGVFDTLSFGVPMVGVLQNEQPMQFGYSISGFIVASAAVIAKPFAGRLDDGVTLTTALLTNQNRVSHPYWLPGRAPVHVFGNEITEVDINGSVVIGATDGEAQDNTRTLMFGLYTRPAQSSVTNMVFDLTISVHRGTDVINTYDVLR